MCEFCYENFRDFSSAFVYVKNMTNKYKQKNVNPWNVLGSDFLVEGVILNCISSKL